MPRHSCLGTVQKIVALRHQNYLDIMYFSMHDEHELQRFLKGDAMLRLAHSTVKAAFKMLVEQELKINRFFHPAPHQTVGFYISGEPRSGSRLARDAAASLPSAPDNSAKKITYFGYTDYGLANRELKNKMSSAFKVEANPHIVIMDDLDILPRETLKEVEHAIVYAFDRYENNSSDTVVMCIGKENTIGPELKARLQKFTLSD